MAKRDETLEMAELYRSGMTMEQIGKRYGISRQTVQQRLAAIGVSSEDRPPKHTLIDKKRLGLLYSEEKISLERIAEAFGVKREVIRQALEFHQIPKRDWIKSGGGSRIDFLKRMHIGDKREATFNRKKSHSLIYMPAKKLGIKVSVHCLGDGKFEITRIG